MKKSILKPVYWKKNSNWKMTIGLIDKKNKIFIKRIKREHQYMEIFRGYGIHSEYFDKYLLPDNYGIIVEEIDTGGRYCTRAKHFNEKGVRRTSQYGPQIFLSLENWQMPVLTPEEKEAETKKILFG